MNAEAATAEPRPHPEPEADEREQARKGVLRDYAETILVCVIFVFFARAFVFQQSKIPTGSMEDTLLPGDYILVDRSGFAPTSFDWERHLLPGRSPRRGDVVVFKYPIEPEVDYIKRVVGVPGDTVQVGLEGVRVNGELLDEPYVAEPYRIGHEDSPPVVVEPGHYFVMGDHRNDSLDSRVWGQVPAELLKGRAVMIWWSFPERDGAHPSASQRMRTWGRKLTGFFTSTRWERCFKLIR